MLEFGAYFRASYKRFTNFAFASIHKTYSAVVNRVVLITGASRGIGRGIALELAGAGWDLVVNYAGNTAAAEKTAQDCLNAARAQARTIRVEACRADISIAAERQQ